MTRRNALPWLLVAAVLTATCSVAAARNKVTDPDKPRSLPVDGHVDVRWTDPAQFSDIRYSGNRWEAERGDWVTQLAEHLRKRASQQLPAGERLEVEITDVRRAGMYEPWHGIAMQDVRILRDHYPPRIELKFERVDANGNLIEEGDRKLVDSAFMMRSTPMNDSDPLRYEKQMLDRWLTQELRDSAS